MVASILAWLSSNSGMIAEVLAGIVVLDHMLAQMSFFKSSSTAQAIFNGVASVIGWVQKLLPGSNPPAPPAA